MSARGDERLDALLLRALADRTLARLIGRTLQAIRRFVALVPEGERHLDANQLEALEQVRAAVMRLDLLSLAEERPELPEGNPPADVTEGATPGDATRRPG